MAGPMLGGLAGALGKPAGPAPAPKPPADELDTVAADLIAAVKAGDAAGVSAALRAAHSICSDYSEE